MSGYPGYVAQHGTEFSYQLAPRAKIFRRDEGKVVDLMSMKKIMRYNGMRSTNTTLTLRTFSLTDMSTQAITDLKEFLKTQDKWMRKQIESNTPKDPLWRHVAMVIVAQYDGLDGCSPLYWLSQQGHTDIVRLLLEKNPKVDVCNKDGRSPLYWASRNGNTHIQVNLGHTDIVKLLLEKDPNVDLCNKDGWSPLNTASQQGHTDIVKLLLEKDPNVDLCNKDGWSPLNTASDKGHTDIKVSVREGS
ncbi:unnamed protein product [Mytilus edulis]|uniref:Phospholipase B-like n=1 Tax=Mytilus edulis TaxID=6550 RepID=A0A8S3QYP3_MYTED|nr:unnamed protein product [Mytilus edulis]